MSEFQLSYLNDQDRLKAYQLITDGCKHLWSKGKLQQDRFKEVADVFIRLADKDPVFLAHFTSYAITKLDSKDLKVVSTFFNALSDADGTPFVVSEGENGKIYSSEYSKPNLRAVSQSALQMLPPKLVLRVIELANLKMVFGERYKEGTHFPKSLKTALKKYIKYREQNLPMIRGIKKAGLRKVLMNLYRRARIAPSTEVAEILRWDQKDGREIKKEAVLSFDGLSDLQIADLIQAEKLSPMIALGALPEKISPVVAVALLEQVTGNQAVILHSMFESQGLLRDKEVQGLFTEKLKTAKDALDRVDRMNTTVNEDVAKVLKTAKAGRRKEVVGDIGKLFVHIDMSPSMHEAIEFAKERGAIIAECVSNPEENFHWGAFTSHGYSIKKPNTYTKDAFMAALYGLRPQGGGTNCLACYPKARELGCDVDIYVTDQEDNSNRMGPIIAECDRKGLGRPKAVVIVHFGRHRQDLKVCLERHQIPVTVIDPDVLTESALVAQAVKTAIKGQVVILDEIMGTKLLSLPKWWEAVE